MGRVDDAKRRIDGADEGAAAASDAAALGAEMFPDEHDASSPADVALARPVEPRLNDVERVNGTHRPEREPAIHSIFSRVDVGVTQKLVIDQQINPASREQYRRLAAALHASQEATGLRVVMIASAVAGEGKTLTSSNLALTLSESYRRRVLLIDADLRRPSLDRVFGLVGGEGLSDGLAADKPKLLIRELSPYLTVLPAGRPSHDPMAGLTSERMRQLVQEARDTFDWVIIDTPPIGLLTDAHLMASMVDGALFVIRANQTPFDMVKRATEAIGRDKILGVVLNGAEEVHHAKYKYYYTNYYRPAIESGNSR